MFNVIVLSPKATKNKDGIFEPYITIPAILMRGTWRVLDMLPTNTAVGMVHFRESLK